MHIDASDAVTIAPILKRMNIAWINQKYSLNIVDVVNILAGQNNWFSTEHL